MAAEKKKEHKEKAENKKAESAKKTEKPAVEKKEAAIQAKKEEKKPDASKDKKEMPKKEKEIKEKKVKVKFEGEKTVEQKKAGKLKEKIRKKRLPQFRGRFGRKDIRRKSKEKWTRWRHPQGIDISLKKEDGALPKTGYRTPRGIRFLHPSGFEETYVRNVAELSGMKKGTVARISGTLGKKSRKTIALKAKELGIRVLNRGFQ